MERAHTHTVGGNDAGAILIMVMVLLLMMALLGIGLLTLGQADAVETARAIRQTQAFWMAEAGLHQCLSRLENDSVYRAAPAALTETHGNYGYSVGVTKTDTRYDLASLGRHLHSDFDRGVRQTVTITEDSWPSAFDYALFGGGGSMDISKDAAIDGSVFQNGDIDFKGGTSVSGEVIATGSVSGYPQDPTPDPIPTMPPLDTTSYDALIATALASGGLPQTYPLDLGGSNVYVQGNESIGDLLGPGTLVIGGNADLSKDVTIGNGVAVVVGGDLKLEKDCQTGTDCLLYAAGDIIFQKDNLLLGPCTILTPGDVIAKKSFEFTGILFAGGSFTSDKEADITGTVVAGGGFDIKKDLNCTYDPSVISNAPPPGVITEIDVTRGNDWEEF